MVKRVKIFLLFFISFLGLFYAFESIKLSELMHHLYALDIFKFSLSIFILIFSCVIRSKRLKYLIAPLDKSISTHHLFGATMIGYFGNGILFFRLGELLKAYAISQGKKIKPSESFGLIMLERLIDALSVLILLIIALPFLPLDNEIIKYWIMTFIIATIFFSGVLYVFSFLNWKLLVDYLTFLNKPLRKKIVKIIDKIYNGTVLFFRAQNKIEIFICTFLIWVCYYLMTKCLIESCNIDLDSFNIFIMLIIGSIIVSVPGLPGGIGTYEAGITYALTFLFFVPKDLALSYAIVSHISNYLPYLIIGFFYFIKSGAKINLIKNNSIQV